jgi:hypothetical protein
MKIYALHDNYDPKRDIHISRLTVGLEYRPACPGCNARRIVPHDPLEGSVVNALHGPSPLVLPCAHVPYLFLSTAVLRKFSKVNLTLPPCFSFHTVFSEKLESWPDFTGFARVAGEQGSRCEIDLDRSGFKGSFVCAVCGTINHDVAATYAARRADDKYVIIADTLPEADLFTTQLSTTLLFCTERLRTACLELGVWQVQFRDVLCE